MRQSHPTYGPFFFATDHDLALSDLAMKSQADVKLSVSLPDAKGDNKLQIS